MISGDPGGRRLESRGGVWRALQYLYVDVDIDVETQPALEGDCWPSLGLGNTAGAEVLEGDVWRALKICPSRRVRMIFPPSAGPLWGSEIQPEPRSWRETSGEHSKSKHYVVPP